MVKCSECGKEIGLNRYKIKHGWLCPDCKNKYLKIYWPTKTIEQLKEDINLTPEQLKIKYKKKRALGWIVAFSIIVSLIVFANIMKEINSDFFTLRSISENITTEDKLTLDISSKTDDISVNGKKITALQKNSFNNYKYNVIEELKLGSNEFIIKMGQIEKEKIQITRMSQEDYDKAKKMQEEQEEATKAAEKKIKEKAIKLKAMDTYCQVGVRTYLRSSLNDPNSYRDVSWSTAIYDESKGIFQIRHQYRAKNGFGAYILENELFILNDDFKVINVVE